MCHTSLYSSRGTKLCLLIFPFPPALTTLTTFSYSSRLSLKSPTVKHDSPDLYNITPLFSFPVSELKAFLRRQTSVSPFLCATLRRVFLLLVALFAAFSDLFIHFCCSTLCMSRISKSEPCMCIMRAKSNSYLKYT